MCPISTRRGGGAAEQGAAQDARSQPLRVRGGERLKGCFVRSALGALSARVTCLEPFFERSFPHPRGEAPGCFLKTQRFAFLGGRAWARSWARARAVMVSMPGAAPGDAAKVAGLVRCNVTCRWGGVTGQAATIYETQRFTK